jgi:hypothetical protein
MTNSVKQPGALIIAAELRDSSFKIVADTFSRLIKGKTHRTFHSHAHQCLKVNVPSWQTGGSKCK